MDEYLVPILKEMCSRVNADYNKIDFKEEEWFREYTWTQEQEKTFTQWLADYLHCNKEVRKLFNILHNSKKKCREAAVEFVWFCGWVTKERKD